MSGYSVGRPLLSIFKSLRDQATSHCARTRYRWGCAAAARWHPAGQALTPKNLSPQTTRNSLTWNELRKSSCGLDNREVHRDEERERNWRNFRQSGQCGARSKPTAQTRNPRIAGVSGYDREGLPSCIGRAWATGIQTRSHVRSQRSVPRRGCYPAKAACCPCPTSGRPSSSVAAQASSRAPPAGPPTAPAD